MLNGHEYRKYYLLKRKINGCWLCNTKCSKSFNTTAHIVPECAAKNSCCLTYGTNSINKNDNKQIKFECDECNKRLSKIDKWAKINNFSFLDVKEKFILRRIYLAKLCALSKNMLLNNKENSYLMKHVKQFKRMCNFVIAHAKNITEVEEHIKEYMKIKLACRPSKHFNVNKKKFTTKRYGWLGHNTGLCTDFPIGNYGLQISFFGYDLNQIFEIEKENLDHNNLCKAHNSFMNVIEI